MPNINVVPINRIASDASGFRAFVGRQWPPGVNRRKLALDAWLKDLAPSPGLRNWFGHSRERWNVFRDRYFRELETKPRELNRLLSLVRNESVTLIHGSPDEECNCAVALREYLLRKMSFSKLSFSDAIDSPTWMPT